MRSFVPDVLLLVYQLSPWEDWCGWDLLSGVLPVSLQMPGISSPCESSHFDCLAFEGQKFPVGLRCGSISNQARRMGGLWKMA